MTTTRTLREELEAAILERHCAHHPMTQKWAAGELSTTAMMGWGIEHYHWVSNVWPTFFYTMATAPNDVRRVLMENYGEENDADRPHLPIVLRFAEANGANVEEVKRGRGLPTTEDTRQQAIHWARESARMRWFYFDGIYLHYELGYKLR